MLGQKLVELRAVVDVINNRLPGASPQIKKARQVNNAVDASSFAIKHLLVLVKWLN